jgi:SIT4-associating protein SAP185/190
MAFWRIGNGFSTISTIDKILDKPDHSLIDLLEEQDLLQELLAPNTKLIEYLREPPVMQDMIKLILEAESPPGHEKDPGEESNELSKTASPDSSKDEGKLVEQAESESQSDSEQSTSSSDFDQESAAIGTGSTPELVPLGKKQHLPHSDQMDTDSDDEDDDEHHRHYREGDSDEENDPNKSLYETKHRHAQVCTQILSADVWSITETLMESETLIDELWKILDYPAPLDISYSTYFTKINEHLLDKKTDEMLAYIRKQKTFVKRIIKHIDNPPLMDFLLKIISSDKPDNSTGIIEFLQVQKLIPRLIEFLGPQVPSSQQSAAGDFLKAFVTISANSSTDNNTIGPNELSRELVSEPVVRELLRLMLYGGTGLATGVGVIIEIIRKNNSDYDFVPVLYITMESHPPGPRDPIYLGTLINVFSESIPKFHEMLTRAHSEKLSTPFGEIEPLGFERFKICELLAELLHCSNMALLNDSSGESIVKARDEERERVKRVIARAKGENGDDDDGSANHFEQFPEGESSRQQPSTQPIQSPGIESGINNLTIKAEAQEHQKTIPEEPMEEEPFHTEQATPADLVVSADEDVIMTDKKEVKSESDEEDSVTSNKSGEEMSLDQIEESIRKDPVVGDRFKIALTENGCVPTILDMFFNFPWNNFLHNVVFDIVQQILNGPMQDGYNRFLAIDLFKVARLTDILCEGQARCEEYERQHKSRLGYMGHLTLISEEVVKFTAVYSAETISPVVAEAVSRPAWITYVTTSLVQTREQYNMILGGRRPESADGERHSDAIILGNGEDDISSELGEIERSQVRIDDDDEEEELEGEIDVEHRGLPGYGHGQGHLAQANDSNSPGGDQFSRYMSQQISGTGHFGSSDEDDDEDEWETERYRNYAQEHARLMEEQHDIEEDDGLGLVRSRSYNDMN